MKRMIRWLALVMLTVPLWGQAAEQDRPPFFQLTHQGHTAWLLGSIHVGMPDFYPMPAMIEQAFDGSRVLALEADPRDPKLPGLMAQYAMADAPLPQSLAQRLQSYCQQQGMPCDTRMQPWLLSAQLAMFQMAKAGYQPQLGVENHWLTRLGEQQVWELEGMAYQLGVFDALPDTAQYEMLEASMAPVDVSVMVNAWREGNQILLAEEIREGMGEDDRLWQALMVDRNHRMSATIGDWLATDSELFIVIGAGHLVGDDNIPGLLEAQGIDVKDCWQEQCG